MERKSKLQLHRETMTLLQADVSVQARGACGQHGRPLPVFTDFTKRTALTREPECMQHPTSIGSEATFTSDATSGTALLCFI